MRLRSVALISCFLICVLNSSGIAAEKASVLADGGLDVLIYNTSTVRISLIDQVTDGCLPGPKKVLKLFKDDLQNRKFRTIVDRNDDFFAPHLEISAFGYATGRNTCAVVFRLSFNQDIVATVPHFGKLPEFFHYTFVPLSETIHIALLTGRKADMQVRVENEAKKAVNDFFTMMDRARINVRTNWPELWDISLGK